MCMGNCEEKHLELQKQAQVELLNQIKTTLDKKRENGFPEILTREELESFYPKKLCKL